MGASAPFWRYSAASYPDLERTVPVDALVGVENGLVNAESDVSSEVFSSSAFDLISPYQKHLLYSVFFVSHASYNLMRVCMRLTLFCGTIGNF